MSCHLPFVIVDGSTNDNGLRTDGHRRVHKAAIVVVEVFLEADTICVGETNVLDTTSVVLGIDIKRKGPTVGLGFIEHPVVEKSISVLCCWHNKSNGASTWT